MQRRHHKHDDERLKQSRHVGQAAQQHLREPARRTGVEHHHAQRQAGDDQDDAAPVHVTLRGLPAQHAEPRKKQQQSPAERHRLRRRVYRATGPGGEKRRGQPDRDRSGEDHQRPYLQPGRRTERVDAVPDLRVRDRQPVELRRKRAQQQPPAGRDHEQQRGHAVGHPPRERDLDPRQLAEIADRGEIGARPGRRADAPDQRAERARDHQRPPEVALERLDLRVTQNPDPQRHEQRRDRHVGDPHGQHRADHQEAEQHPVGPGADPVKHVQHEPRAEPRVRESGGKEQDPDEERDQRIAETGRHHRRVVGNPEDRDQQQHDQRGHRERHRLGHPQGDGERQDREARLAVRRKGDLFTGPHDRGRFGKRVDHQHQQQSQKNGGGAQRVGHRRLPIVAGGR